MNLLDVVVLVWAGVAAFGGYRRGAVLQVTEYVGLIAGLVLGAVVAPHIARLVQPGLEQALLALVALVAVAALGELVGWLAGRRIWAVTHRTILGPIDAGAGSVVSVVAVLLATWFLAYSLSAGPFPPLSREIRSSAIVRGLDGALPRPPALLAQIRVFLNRFGFPDVFAGLPPEPAGPVKGLTSKQAEAIARQGDASTVKIVGQACGAIQSGSGFVGASHYVVTNAHVVAGISRPEVRFPGGTAETGVPVLFDPRLDVAILFVSSTPAPVLPLDPGAVDRGTQGAVIGYPGGGAETVAAGAVRRELSAVGRDIYGRSIVSRSIYELQAQVIPGDSGGPFLLADGRVGGLVFAASTTDSKIGYALTSPDVLARLRQAEGRTGAVSTDGCAR